MTLRAENEIDIISKVSYCAWENNLNTSDKETDTYANNHEIKSVLLRHTIAKINVARMITIVVAKCITK